MKRVAVIGGGASGIAAAHYLQELGYEPEILESTGTFGGRMGSAVLGHRTIDFGGKNIGRNYPLFRKFVEGLGEFHYEFFGINTSVAPDEEDGVLRRLDSEAARKSLGNLVRLVGIRDFVKIAMLVRAVRANEQNGYLGGEYFNAVSKRQDEHPISHYFGDRAMRHFVRPLLVRMNGAEPDEYSAGNFGSNLKMVLDKYDQIAEGLYGVLDRFREHVHVQTGTTVKRLLVTGNRVEGVEVTCGGRTERRYYDGVVVAVPANAASALLTPCMEQVSRILSEVAYYPVAVAVVEYENDVFTEATRALIFNERYELSNAGAYAADQLNVVRYTFSGRRFRESFTEGTSAESAVAIGERYLRRYFPSTYVRKASVYRYFATGLCAYVPYHHRFLARLEAEIARYEGVTLTGDYVRGASIEACFRAAYESVSRLHEQWRRVSSNEGCEPRVSETSIGV